MRKVLSFVLVLSLVLGSFGMAFAATPATPSKTELNDIKGLACEDAVRVLSSLNVVSGYKDGSYKPEQTVTRAEMASLIINALGLKETNATPKFTDSKNHWAAGYIAYANTLGIISGRSATIFDPDATVTYDEATTMLVKALGYRDEALVGTYPASYVSRAKVLGILDGIQTGSGGANRGDIAVMLYQTLDQAIGKVNADGDFVATVIEWEKGDGNATGVKKYDTMLDRLGAEIYEAKSGYQKPEVDDEAFLLTGDEDAIINLIPFKGAVVSAYVNSDDDIIAIKEVFTTFVTGVFDDNKFDADTPFITADGTEYTMKKDAYDGDIGNGTVSNGSAATFINGDENENISGVLGNSSGTKTVYTLAAEISGKKITDIHSVLRWDIDDADQIGEDDLSDIKNNHKLFGIDFEEDNNGDIDTDEFELIGIDSLDDLKVDDVVYAYKKDDKIIRIAVSDKTVEGNVSAVNDSGKKVTIDGTTYKFASVEMLGNHGDIAPAKADTNKDLVDEDTRLLLDAYGYIYDTEDSTQGNYAVVLEAGIGGDLNKDNKVKLYLADGTTKIFGLDDDADDAYNTVAKAEALRGQLIKYKLNKSGDITDIYVNGASADNDLIFKNVLAAGGDDVTAKGYFDGRKIAKNAVLFVYDGDESDFVNNVGKMDFDDDDMGTAVYDKILEAEDVQAYYIWDKSDKEITAMFMFNVTSANDVYGIISGRGKNNSDAGAYYDMLVDGKEVRYNGTDSSAANKYGADGNFLYLVKYDGNGDIKRFDEWYTSGDDVLKAQIAIANAKNANLDRDVFEYGADSVEAINVWKSTDGVTVTAQGSVHSVEIDNSAVVYVQEDDGDWKLGGSVSSELRDLSDNDTVVFYDVDNEDKVYDIVVIYEGDAPVVPTPVAPIKIEAITVGGIGLTESAIKTLNSSNKASVDVSAASFAALTKTVQVSPAALDVQDVRLSTNAAIGTLSFTLASTDNEASYTVTFNNTTAQANADATLKAATAAGITGKVDASGVTFEMTQAQADALTRGAITGAAEQAGASVAVNGPEKGPWTIKVTAADGTTTKAYSVTVKVKGDVAPSVKEITGASLTITSSALTRTATAGGLQTTLAGIRSQVAHATGTFSFVNQDGYEFVDTDPLGTGMINVIITFKADAGYKFNIASDVTINGVKSNVKYEVSSDGKTLTVTWLKMIP